MKSFFLLVFGLVLPLGLSAVNISSVYFSSCNRENGVIIHVDENRVQMLGLEGTILDIPRYEIIYTKCMTIFLKGRLIRTGAGGCCRPPPESDHQAPHNCHVNVDVSCCLIIML